MAVALAPGLPDGHAGLSRALAPEGPARGRPQRRRRAHRPVRLPAHRARVEEPAQPRHGGRPALRLRVRVGARRRAAPAARRAAAPRPRGVAGSGPEPLRGARPAAAAPAPAGRDLPGLGLAAAVVARAPVRLPRPRREGPRLRAGGGGARRGPGGGRARAPPAHGAEPALPRGARGRGGVARARGDRAPGGGGRARPRGPGPPLPARAARGGARAATKRPRSCTGGCSPEIPPTPSPGTTSRTSSSSRGGYDSARARYRAGTEGGTAPEVAATSYYNLSLAHLQKFEYQAYNEAKSNADRLAPGLVADYDRWKYDSGDYAVVDLDLTPAQVRDKFEGAESGVAARNVAAGERPPAPPATARRCAGEPLRGVARGVRPRRLPGRALARAEGLHPPLRPLRDGFLPLLPPRRR